MWDHARDGDFRGGADGALFRASGLRAATEQISVPRRPRPATSSAAFFAERGSIDLLKIDIEGGELRALNDITDDQLRAIRTILVEGEDVPMDRMERAGMRRHTFSSGIHRFTWDESSASGAGAAASVQS